VAACRRNGVAFRFAADVTRLPGLLTPFDRVVVATGARSRFGLGALVEGLLASGLARAPLVARLFSAAAVRDWFYYRARRGTAAQFERLLRPGQIVTVIGDAAGAGKSKPAIASAFE